MPRACYRMTDADVPVVHRWVRSKFPETAPLEHPITKQLQQWCTRCLEAAQWKQLHAVIRAARRDASHQTRTVRLSTRASALLHDLAAREQLTLSETIERYLPAVTLTPTHQAPPPIAEQPPVPPAATRTDVPKQARAAVALQKRSQAWVRYRSWSRITSGVLLSVLGRCSMAPRKSSIKLCRTLMPRSCGNIFTK